LKPTTLFLSVHLYDDGSAQLDSHAHHPNSTTYARSTQTFQTWSRQSWKRIHRISQKKHLVNNI